MRWKEELKSRIKTLDQLEEYFHFSDGERAGMKQIIEMFPMEITPYYFDLIHFNDSNDPIKKIIIPSIEEILEDGCYDQSGEALNTKVKGLQHKYGPTALILLDSVCASYCRFCFRKRLMNRNTSSDEIINDFDLALDYIAEHKEINNVLLSGGDPFMLENETIEYILRKLREIKHVNIIRIGSKMPAFLPFRFTEDTKLLDILEKYNTPNKRIYLISHFDHPRELTWQALEAIDALKKRGITICNQTVLLGGVNNDPRVLANLFNKMAACGVEPYYLFQCRPVTSSLHSQVPLVAGYHAYELAKRELGGLAKRVKYIMSHFLGKIEIINIIHNEEYITGFFKFHQSRYLENEGQFFRMKLPEDACWIEEEEIEETLSQEHEHFYNA